MKALLSDIRAALGSREFASRFKGRQFWDAAAFLLQLCIIQAFVLAAIALGTLIPSLGEFMGRDLVTDFYPEGLEVHITDGVVSTNVEQPYFIDTDEDDSFAHFLTIDTTAEDPYSALKTYDTQVFIGKNAVAFEKSNGAEVRVLSLEDVEKVDISAESVREFLHTASPVFYALLVVFGIFALLFIIAGTLVYYLVLLLILALITWAMGKVGKFNLTYSQSYILSAYALTLPLLAAILLDILLLKLPFFVLIGLFLLAIATNLALSSRTPSQNV